MAKRYANLDVTTIDPERAGVIIGSGIGGLTTIEDTHEIYRTKGIKRISPFIYHLPQSTWLQV